MLFQRAIERKLTQVSLIYRTEPTTKNGKTEINGYAQKFRLYSTALLLSVCIECRGIVWFC